MKAVYLERVGGVLDLTQTTLGVEPANRQRRETAEPARMIAPELGCKLVAEPRGLAPRFHVTARRQEARHERCGCAIAVHVVEILCQRPIERRRAAPRRGDAASAAPRLHRQDFGQLEMVMEIDASRARGAATLRIQRSCADKR